MWRLSCIGRQPCTHNQSGSAISLPKMATAEGRSLRRLRQKIILSSEGLGIMTETMGRAGNKPMLIQLGAGVTGIMTRSRGLAGIVAVNGLILKVMTRSRGFRLKTRVRSLHRPLCGQSATMKASGPGLTIRSHPYPRLGTRVRRLHPQRITYPRMHRSLHRRQRDLHQQVPQLRDHVLDMLKYRRTFTP